MRILFTKPYKTKGGVSSFCEAIIPALYMHDVTVFKRGVKENRSNIIFILFEQIINYMSFLFLMVFNKYDIVFINSSLGKTTCIRDGIHITLSKIFNNKVLLFIHGFEERYLNNKHLTKSFFLSDRIIVLAKEFKVQLKNAGYTKKIDVLNNPVDKELITSTSQNDLELRKKKRPENILFISRIEEQKGIMIALQIFEKLYQSNPNMTFYIAGDGSKLNDAKLYTKIKKINNVKFLGFVTGKEKTELFKKCDVLLFPTYNEGLPINILEAMAAGLSIITRPVGGIKDFFENEKMGYAIESLDADMFVEKIEELINSDNYFNICEYNYNYARKNFSSKIIANNLIDIMKEVIN